MRVTNISPKIIAADEGHILTNGESYGYTVALGIYDSALNWYEITEEEYQTILAQQEEELNNILI